MSAIGNHTVLVCVHFIYTRDVFCSTVATCTIMYIIMRGGAWVGRASEAVNIVKCLLQWVPVNIILAVQALFIPLSGIF